MAGLSLYERILLILQALALVGLIARLAWMRLVKAYPFFFCLLAAETCQSIIPFTVNLRSNLYGYLFLVTETFIVCCYALVVLELYTTVLKDLSGIARLSRKYTQIAMALAISVSVLLLFLERTPVNLIAAFYTFERAIVSSLVVFVLLITALLVYYPIPLNRNVIVYSIGYALYFLSKATALFARNLGVAAHAIVSTILVTVSTVCLLIWLIFLDRQGEKKAVVMGHRWDREREQELMKKIQALNETLLRTAPK